MESRKFKVIMGYVYGFGAAVVLIGALFKLTHWLPGPVANIMLAVGLGVEALIFILSSFEPPHVEPDWSLVYPELRAMYHGEGKAPSTNKKAETRVRQSSGQLDELLSGANISSETLEKLSAGINKLSENASQMADISNAVAATKNYADAMDKAAKSVGTINEQLEKTAKVVTKSDDLCNAMSTYIEKLNVTVKTTDSINAQMASMSKNMENLNKVYGGMLSAMNFKG